MDYGIYTPKLLSQRSAAIVCSALISVGATLLYLDWYEIGPRGKGEPLAVVETFSRNVRHRSAEDFLWNRLEKNQSLFRNDAIQVGSKSTAVLRLADNTRIEISPNTLVVIKKTSELPIRVERGEIYWDQHISRTKIKADDNQVVQKISVLYRPVSPMPMADFFTIDGKMPKIIFDWEPTDSSLAELTEKERKRYALEVGTDIEFKKILQRIVAPKPKQELASPLFPGIYFWRLLVGGTEVTSPREFHIREVTPLKPTWPANGETIRNWNEMTNLSFRWSSDQSFTEATAQLATHYDHVIEVSTTANFDEIAYSQKVSPLAGATVFDAIPLGTYYWRLVSEYPGMAISSKAEKFTLEKTEKLTIRELFPEDESSFSSSQSVKFSWKLDGSETNFDWQLEREDDAHTPMLTQTLTEPEFIWRKPQNGAFRWRVVAKNGDDIVGESNWSKITVFREGEISIAQPSDREVMHFWGNRTEFELKWSGDLNEESETFRVQVSPDSSFGEETLTKDTRQSRLSSGQLMLEPGNYFWRVRKVDPSGEVLASSRTLQFTWETYPLLPHPENAFPNDGHSYSLTKRKVNPSISWTPVPHAKAYEVTFKGSGSDRVIRTANSELSTRAFGQGSWRWSVRAIDPLERKGHPSAWKSFSQSYGPPIAAPETISPEAP